MLDEVVIHCPYCGEAQTVLADASAGAASYIEDCQVCCQPMRIDLHVDAQGELTGVEASAEQL